MKFSLDIRKTIEVENEELTIELERLKSEGYIVRRITPIEEREIPDEIEDEFLNNGESDN